MEKNTAFNWRVFVRFGLLAGVIGLSLSLIGMVETFSERAIIGGIVTLGEILLFGSVLGAGFLAARELEEDQRISTNLAGGLLLGVTAGLPLILLLLASIPRSEDGTIALRQFLLNASPQLINLLTFGQTIQIGALVLLGVSALMGILGALGYQIQPRIRRPLLVGLVSVLLIGLLSEVIILAWGTRGLGLVIRRVLFAQKGLSPLGALVLFALFATINVFSGGWRDRYQAWTDSHNPAQQQRLRRSTWVLYALLLAILPFILRTYLTEVIDNVLMYVLMGLGLNIVVGFAGLLDLGYVAFFAIGAYTMGVLTSTGELGVATISFWAALPIAVVASVVAGVILGIPVLRMRGDYLAIVTLGFGEIIRILALSDALAPFIGGAQGILKIPKAQIGAFQFITPERLYYIFLVGCLIAIFVSTRLRDSRLGRQWMAMREDEDVAEAMGINLVKTKLLAFGTGAAFSGLAGAIFASKLSSIFPHSFNLLVSINVLSLIIVGGMGSIPGVVVGALLLVGLPELLREFAEFRLLMYGALLIGMMIVRPEGFWPSAVTKRELHIHEEFPAPATTD
jgi:branched-chain amino acid transport system permease protein